MYNSSTTCNLSGSVVSLAIYEIVYSNVMCCTIRGYDVITQSDGSERDTITYYRIVYTMCND